MSSCPRLRHCMTSLVRISRVRRVTVTVSVSVSLSLARSAKLPTRLYSLLALISFFYYQQSYLRIYWTDFHDFFSPNGRYLREFSRSVPAFSNSSRDVAMATNFVSYQIFLLGAKVSQDPLDRFLQSLYHMVGIELQMINPTFFS